MLYWFVCPKPHPGTRVILPTRSGCWSSIPVSTTAIVTSLEPFVISQASGAPIASKCHGTPYGAHPPKQGSLGFDIADSSAKSWVFVSAAKRWPGEIQVSVITTSDKAALIRTLGLPEGVTEREYPALGSYWDRYLDQESFFFSNSRSCSTIIVTRSWKDTSGCHPNWLLAFEASPTSRSTSAGRKNRWSMRT